MPITSGPLPPMPRHAVQLRGGPRDGWALDVLDGAALVVVPWLPEPGIWLATGRGIEWHEYDGTTGAYVGPERPR